MAASAGRVKGGVSGRELRALGDPNHMQHDAYDEGNHQYPRAEPAHGVQILQCDGKERHGIIIDNRKEQFAISPNEIGHNPQELHKVVNVVDQAALRNA